jgi:hypothetical protein
MKKLTHLLYIPDGMRRYAKKEGTPLNESYIKGAKLLVEATKSILLEPSFVEELSLYPLAAYNLLRTEQEVEGLAVWSFVFFRGLSKLRESNDFYVTLVGRDDLIQTLTYEGWTYLHSILDRNNSESARRLNLLFAYESLRSWPDDIPPYEWKPFRHSIDMIFRFGQPKDAVRGSAIFPMSEHAFWSGTTILFPDADIAATNEHILGLFTSCQ